MSYYPAVYKRMVPACVLALALTLASAPAWAWGCAGHQIIALIAAAHLQPEVAAQVRRILRIPLHAPLGEGRPCRGAAALPGMARVAGWADAHRTPATAGFHFVDLPLNARRGHGDYAPACAGACLTVALARFEAELRRPASPEQQALALRYVIHLVGDAFQPLHASDDQDRGGNCVETRLPHARHRGNLHADWDTQFLAGMMGAATPVAYARSLDARFGRRFAAASPDPKDWIWHSHALAVQVAYAPLHLAPGCHRKTLRLTAAYVRGARAAIAPQLDRAGWRLAATLNHLLSSDRPNS